MKIIGTGLSGLVGSRVVELLSGQHRFEDLSLDKGVDITDHSFVASRIRQSEADWVFHFAAYTDVQGAQKEENLGESSLAWKINVLATDNIVHIAKETGKRVVYIDTDYAFDGTKEFYLEEDVPNPLGWYAKTKAEGARRVQALADHALILRIANPYRAGVVGKKDFVHKMLERLMRGDTLAAATDQIFVPTYIDDIAYALDVCLQKNASGLFHVVGSSALSPYDAACLVAKIWGFSPNLVTRTTFAKFFDGRAPIPQYAHLRNDKITSLGVRMRTFEEGLQDVRKIEYNG